MSITKEQRDEIKRRAALLVPDGPCAYRLANLTDYLDSLVAEPAMSRCSDELREQGKAYPRTCAECGLGPCKRKGVAEPAEQPMFANAETMVAVTRALESQQKADDDRLHADDARAAMAALICEPRWGLSGSEHGVAAAFAHAAHELADAMAAERKRRQG